MNIGMLVNSALHLSDIIGLTRAAVDKGHRISIFVMDDGTKLFRDPAFLELAGLEGVSMSFCDHSAKGLGVDTEDLPSGIVCGSQYNNAVMMHDADRIIVL